MTSVDLALAVSLCLFDTLIFAYRSRLDTGPAELPVVKSHENNGGHLRRGAAERRVFPFASYIPGRIIIYQHSLENSQF